MKLQSFTALFIGFALYCNAQTTFVPDDNFENYLETHDASGNLVALGDPTSMGNGVANDDLVTTTRINTVVNLAVNSLNIADLTGIEDFYALQNLRCDNNQLTSLSLTQNTALEELWCYANQLMNLDITQSIALEELWCFSNLLTNIDITQNTLFKNIRCFGNLLTNLDVTQNSLLENLECNNNQLTSLDVTQNTNLEALTCSVNQITSLDVSQNVALTSLGCHINQLTNLDVTENTALEVLSCRTNMLTSLNVKNGNNTNIVFFDSRFNPNLICIEVDDDMYSSANWSLIDPNSTFVNNQDECNALSIDNKEKIQFLLYPNPTHGDIIISSSEDSVYQLFTINGAALQSGILVSGNNQLDISQLPSGLYFIRLERDQGYSTQKLIKH